METLKLRTDIKCMGCVSKVAPYLNETVGENNWNVDINDPAKILTISAYGDEGKIKETLKKAGFKGESL